MVRSGIRDASSRTGQGGTYMINSVDIKRFRGFNVARLSECKLINIVVGENGAGKTSLLEAIFLAAAQSPEVAIRLRGFRGLAEGQIQGSPAQIEDAMWRDLFHRFDKEKSVVITLKGDANHNRSLAISYNEQSSSFPISGKDDVPLTSNAPVLFKWKSGDNEFKVRPLIENGEMKLPVGPRLATETFFFAANHTYSSRETAGRYSMLSRSFKESEVIGLFKEHFKNVEDLSIEVGAGAAMVYAKVASMPEKVPLSLLSGGMSKLASILFAIPSQKNGVVLIDEIENGLYYKRLPVVWKSLHAFCKKYDTQVFASTHSAECLHAAAELATKFPDDFSVAYVGSKDGASTLRQFGGDKFVDAINDEIEIR